ncbi:trehalose operon repressor [Streptococcus merionis]|uniref:trehalose operon repressor n=1 Tax=Streptococcus merionis TaxID=400065 RepID=UPI0026EB8E6B|nr:trehalose operon repressor [Streptococcus merionis]
MPKAKYENIYKSLRRKIENGEYPYGELVPSEHTLIAIYECSRNTIRRALAGLAEDGYVQSIHGKGVRVIYQKIERAVFSVGGIETFKETAKRNRLSVDTKVINFSEITVDEKLSRETGFVQGDEVYYVQRVRYLDGKALILDTNFFLKSMVPGMTKEIAEDSIYEYIENKLGMQITTTKRQITVEHATALDEKWLDLGDYDCLAVTAGQTFNADGMMFEYAQSRHQPEYFSFQNVVSRKKTI